MKLILPILFFVITVNAQSVKQTNEYQPSIDPIVGMNDGESESVKMANEAIKKGQEAYKTLNEDAQKHRNNRENTKVVKFDEVYNSNVNSGQYYTQNSDTSSNTQNTSNEPVDLASSPEDKNFSWQGEKINVDDYYEMQKDGTYIRKDRTTNNNGSDNRILLIVIGFVGLIAIFGFIYQNNQTKNNKNINNSSSNSGNSSNNNNINVNNTDNSFNRTTRLKNSLIQTFEVNYKENYKNYGNDKLLLASMASSSLNDLKATLLSKSSSLSNQYDITESDTIYAIEDSFRTVYYKYFEP